MNLTKLRKLRVKEKVKIVETLWADIAANEASFRSPDWHEEELRKTERDFAAGNIEVLDWEDAKKELRRRLG